MSEPYSLTETRPSRSAIREINAASKLKAGDLVDLLNCQADPVNLPDTQQDRVNQVNPLSFPAIADRPRSTSHAWKERDKILRVACLLRGICVS
jgi:hypothetical protein